MGPIDPRLLRRSPPARRFLALTVGLGVLATVATVGQAWFVAHGVARAFAGRDVVAPALGLAGCLVARGVLDWLQSVMSVRAAADVKAGLRHDLVSTVLDPRRVDPLPESARLATLVDGGLDRLDGYVARFLPQLVLTAITPPAVVAVLLVVDPLSALVVTLTVPLVLVFLVLVGLVTRDRTDRRWHELARLGRHFSEVLGGLTVLTALGRDQERGLREVGERHRRVSMETLRTAFLSALVLELFSTLSVALVAVSIGLRVVHGDLDLETGLFALLLAPEAYLPLRRLGAQYHDSTAGVEAAQEALAVLEGGRSTGSVPPGPHVRLVLRDVEVHYAGRVQPALRLDHAVVGPGEMVAVTGASGCGKSTLLAVLLGLAPVDAGRVTIAGVDLADLDVELWRRQVAWVPQVPAVVSGTVSDNVRLGAPDATDQEVRQALCDASASDLALDRVVGESGLGLSSGERRRVGLARAFLRVRAGGARLVLMDEPTAGLDAEREHAVLATLREMALLGVTVVLVAHRPEAVAAADRQLRLEVPVGVLA